MTAEDTNDYAALAAIVEEQKAAIVALSEKVKGYESKMAEYEKKFTAASAPKPAPAAPAAAKQPEISPQDAAYEKVLRDLGLKIKED